MKKSRICLLLSLLSLFSCFTLWGCQKEKNPSGENSGQPGNQTMIDLSEYTVVRGDSATEYEKNAAGALKRSLTEKTGKNISIETDFLKKGQSADESAKEILVGSTNRPQSTDTAGMLPECGFLIRMCGTKLVILGSDDFMTCEAVDWFLENVAVENWNFTLSSDYQAEKKIEPISFSEGESWTVIRGVSAGTSVAACASSIRTRLRSKVCPDIKIGSDITEKGEFEILVGETNRKESKYVMDSLSEYGYAIRAVNGKLVIAGANAFCLQVAVNRFLSEVAPESAQTLMISPALSLKSSNAYMALEEDTHKELSNADFSALDQLYQGYNPYVGDLHAHSNAGSRSDGSCSLAELRQQAQSMGLDFIEVADHHQTEHLDDPDWDTAFFISASEPGTHIQNGSKSEFHYIFFAPTTQALKQIVTHYKSVFGYNGNTFNYPQWTDEMFREFVAYVQSVGGSVTICHPAQYFTPDIGPVPTDPMYWYFGDRTLFEVLYCNIKYSSMKTNYSLWAGLLSLGKKVYCSSATDTHGEMYVNGSMSTVYAKECQDALLCKSITNGMFVAGMADIRMAIGNTAMGGDAVYTGNGQTLLVRISDVQYGGNQYRVRIYTDKGIACEKILSGKEVNEIALEVQDREFYRVEVASVDGSEIYALSQPIWLS